MIMISKFKLFIMILSEMLLDLFIINTFNLNYYLIFKELFT